MKTHDRVNRRVPFLGLGAGLIGTSQRILTLPCS